MKHTILTLLVALTLAACGEDRKPVEALEKTTMDLHDEAMKAMGPMNKTATAIRKTLKTTDSLSQRYQDLQAAATAIERAEADMMDWMEQYQSPADSVPVARAVEYLTTQKARMEQNFNDIKAASERGAKLLDGGK
jgi:hypothetical protein